MKKNTPNILKLSRLAILLLCSILLVGCTVATSKFLLKSQGKNAKNLGS